ncbi:MAG TPA: DUF2330 domain-containing protein, partial [Polyangiaceae bacterium]
MSRRGQLAGTAARDIGVAGGVLGRSRWEVVMLLRSSLAWSCALGAAVAWVAVDARDARACGGCFHQPPPPTETVDSVVTAHRMALSISTQQTVLWDQIQYTGTPSDFAWVLPVKPGSRIELSQDAWLASLDAATETVIYGPTVSCPGTSSPPAEYDNAGGGGGGGCGTSAGSGEGFSAGGYADAGASLADASTGSQVQVVSQEVVGPYDAVTVHSSQGEALGDWLRANGYDVPESLQPTI